jgi:cyclic pyranopterin phosphate synthase
MVDVGEKASTVRRAAAEGVVTLSAEAFRRVRANRIAKGDVLTVAKIAGIQAAKEAARLIPLCHPIPIDAIRVDLALAPIGKSARTPRGGGSPSRRQIRIEAEVSTRAPTGVEMEAMTAVAVAALTVYDMCKAIDRGITIGDVRLVSKSGGRSGAWAASESESARASIATGSGTRAGNAREQRRRKRRADR